MITVTCFVNIDRYMTDYSVWQSRQSSEHGHMQFCRSKHSV